MKTRRLTAGSNPDTPAAPNLNLDPSLRKQETELVSDADGRMTFPVLIPGGTYRFIAYTTSGEAGPQLRQEFSVKSGETLDVVEIRIETPRS
jgi:hypothetical protein